jgi:hypothetical protein
MSDSFEGRGQAISDGTRLDRSNSYAQIGSSIPVAGYYVNDSNSYNDIPSNTVLPAFDSTHKTSGSYSARFSLQSVGRSTKGGSFYHYQIDSPQRELRTTFWWRFDSALGDAGGNPALATARTSYSGQGLTYLRFTPGRNLALENAGNWTLNTGSHRYEPDTWYFIDLTLDTNQNTSTLVVKDDQQRTLQTTSHSIPNVSQIGFFEFGALQANLQSYSQPGSFWFDDMNVGVGS